MIANATPRRASPLMRLCTRYRRIMAGHCVREEVPLKHTAPIVSFTFDDFPQSSWLNGGRILRDHGFLATYYVALSLMGKLTSYGQMFEETDLLEVHAEGNELGCHTFSHHDSWRTPPAEFAADLDRNQAAIKTILPDLVFQTMSFPISSPAPGNKRAASVRYRCSRGGEQRVNLVRIDRNNLAAYFIEQSHGNLERIKSRLDQAVRHNGWLILATHDVSDQPTRYGTTSAYFADIVRAVAESGAKVMPVATAWRTLTDVA